MRIFDFFRKDPTAGWPRYGDQPLHFSLNETRLNSWRIGQDYEALESLGRPDNRRPVAGGRFIYLRLGLIVDLENERLEGFGFVMADEAGQGFSPCRLTLELPGGAKLSLGPETKAGEILQALGEPQSRQEDEDEWVHTYPWQRHTAEFEYTPQGQLKRLEVYPE
ncbi:MAG: hypothetical protein HY717_00565 [Planctomycetes bacterium]|nr:hypothetical protein [Planctomycetota bacterium]